MPHLSLYNLVGSDRITKEGDHTSSYASVNKSGISPGVMSTYWGRPYADWVALPIIYYLTRFERPPYLVPFSFASISMFRCVLISSHKICVGYRSLSLISTLTNLSRSYVIRDKCYSHEYMYHVPPRPRTESINWLLGLGHLGGPHGKVVFRSSGLAVQKWMPPGDECHHVSCLEGSPKI